MKNEPPKEVQPASEHHPEEEEPRDEIKREEDPPVQEKEEKVIENPFNQYLRNVKRRDQENLEDGE